MVSLHGLTHWYLVDPIPMPRRYLFGWVLQIIYNNFKEETRTNQMDELISHFQNSGYNPQQLEEMKEKAVNRLTTNSTRTTEDKETLVFPINFFEGLQEFKTMINNLQNDIKQLIGDTRIMFAVKKGSSIGNSFVRNKALCTQDPTTAQNQRCNAPGCQQCPLVNTEKKFTINDINISIPASLNCKSRNVIYLWKCKLCRESDCYFGRTTQKCHCRTNGHRGCFSDEKWDKSALSMHAQDVHGSDFSLKNFTISIVRKVSPQHIRREEFRFIEKYRTIPLGLNRYKAS